MVNIRGSTETVRSLALAVDRRLPVSVRRRVRYSTRFRRPLPLKHPRTFTEKVQWRMVHDRRDLLAPTCDKLWMKDYAAAAGVPGLRVPQTHWSGTDVAELVGVNLPDRWILKPNHRFGLVYFGGGSPDVPALRTTTAGWLEEPRSLRGEWAYGQAHRCLLVEEMIGTRPPIDYKVFVFDGVPALVQVSTDRFSYHRIRYYTPQWQSVGGSTAREKADPLPRPELLEEMLDAASILGRPYDFMRVDLYQVEGQVWFGELTPYPASGLMRFDPPELDLAVGSLWHLPKLTAASSPLFGTQDLTTHPTRWNRPRHG